MGVTELAVFTCYLCAQRAAACANCVTAITIDPLTDLPLDIVSDGQGGYVRIEVAAISTAARARAVQCCVCDACATGRFGQPEASADRHARLAHIGGCQPVRAI